MSEETPIVNDAITADDTGFNSDAGNQVVEEIVASEESSEAPVAEAAEGETTEVQAETVEELQEEVEEAIADGASEEEVQSMIREFKLKVNGKEITRKLDLSDEEAITRELQKAYAGQLAMQKQKELEKTYEEDVRALLEDPFATLEKLGLNPDELAEQRIRAKVEELQKSPEQREREQLQRELAAEREKLKQIEEEKARVEKEQLEQQAAIQLENEILEALDAHTRLSANPKIIGRIADMMYWAEENGFPGTSAKEVLPLVEQEIRDEVRQMMDEMPEEMMEEYIGKKNLERLRNKRLSAKKPNNISNVKPTTEAVQAKKEEKPKKKMRAKDYFKNL
jgi:hypothetical protein